MPIAVFILFAKASPEIGKKKRNEKNVTAKRKRGCSVKTEKKLFFFLCFISSHVSFCPDISARYFSIDALLDNRNLSFKSQCQIQY